MPSCPFLRERRSEGDRVLKVRIAAATEIVLCLGLVTVVLCQFGEMIEHFTRPCGMRRLVDIFDAPRQFLMCGLSLTKEARKLRVDYSGDPVDDENLAP